MHPVDAATGEQEEGVADVRKRRIPRWQATKRNTRRFDATSHLVPSGNPRLRRAMQATYRSVHLPGDLLRRASRVRFVPFPSPGVREVPRPPSSRVWSDVVRCIDVLRTPVVRRSLRFDAESNARVSFLRSDGRTHAPFTCVESPRTFLPLPATVERWTSHRARLVARFVAPIRPRARRNSLGGTVSGRATIPRS